MHKPDFRQFKTALLDAGIAPKHARRAVTEIREHYDDIVEAHVINGLDREVAKRLATQDIGDLGEIAEVMSSYPELRCWALRFPRVAVVVYPLTCLALLPAVPVFAGVAHAPQVARWSMSLLLGALVTATMFLVMQLSILLT